MKKTVLLTLLLALYSIILATSIYANSLLQNPATGAISTLSFTRLCMISNGTDVVLVAACSNNSVYAMDIADNNIGDASANIITTIPNFITNKLNASAGQPVIVIDMAVNPLSKAIYILGKNTANSTCYFFKVTDAGSTVTLLNLNNIKYSKINWGSGTNILDITWGNNNLYLSGSDVSSLNGELGWISAPFANNTTVTKRATSMYKSNWGQTYFTDAPLETMVYGYINSKHRLLGVTTCAPGFSLDISTLSGNGLLKVTEDFNINTGTSSKVIYQYHDNKSWLFDLHQSKLYRIGEKYIDGSQVGVNKYNQNAVMLRDNNENPSPGLSDDEIKKYTGTYQWAAYWDDYRLLVLEIASEGGALKLMQTAATAPPAGVVGNLSKAKDLKIYPNPAKDIIHLELDNHYIGGTITITSIDGKVVNQNHIGTLRPAINIQEFPKGQYQIKVIAPDDSKQSATFIVQ